MKKIFTFFAAMTFVLSMNAAPETVYFVNALDWTGTIKAYGWGGTKTDTWPGNPMTKETEQIAGKDVYSYTKEAGTYPNIIFNNGSKQTADLKWNAGKYYVIDGWYTKEEVAEKLGQPIEDVYIVAGQSALMGSEWSTADPVNKMTKQADGSYKLVKENLQLAIGSYEYKVTKNYSWDWCLPVEGNNTLKIATAGTYTVTFTLNAALDNISAQATLTQKDPNQEVKLPVVVLAGEMNEWSTTATPFVAAADSLTASVAVELQAQTYAFKVVVDNSWLSNLTEITRDACSNIVFDVLDGEETNAKIVADVAGTYTFVWTYADKTLSVTFPTVSAVEDVQADSHTKKFIRNGQLYIIRDGVQFNILGQVTK